MIAQALAAIVGGSVGRRSWGAGMCWHVEQTRSGMPGAPQREAILWTLYQECEGGRWYLLTNMRPVPIYQCVPDALGLLRDKLNKGLKPAEV